jgi:SAM-dependent methyltransferase
MEDKYTAEYWRERDYTFERSARVFSPMAGYIFSQLFPHDRVIDVGCAMGYMVHWLRHYGMEAIGCDASRYCIENTHESVRNFVFLADARDLPYENDEYDVVVCVDTLEHISEPWQALKEMGRVCWKWLFMIITVTDDPSVSHILPAGAKDDPTHVYITGEPHWRRMLEETLPDFERCVDKERVFRETVGKILPWVSFVYRRK